MAGERRVPLSNRKSNEVAEPSKKRFSYGRFFAGTVAGVVVSGVIFVAMAFVIPPETQTTVASAPLEAEPAVEPEAEAPASQETPEEDTAAADLPQPVEEAVEDDQQVAVASTPAPETAAEPPADGPDAWQAHRAAFNASSTIPLIAIVLETPDESEIPADAILGLGIPFTIALVPRDEGSTQFGEKVRAAGLEVLAHVPMEETGTPPSDSEIRSGMPETQVRELTRGYLDRLPSAVGLSTQGGSAVTGDATIMSAVIEELQRGGYAFVDVHAGGEGAGFSIAQGAGTPAVRNSLVLAPDTPEDAVYDLIEAAARDAVAGGEVVVFAKTSASVLLGISRWALERNGKDARLAPLTAVVERRN
ncbi:MAG: divergent polysaccharide deacetylase family protein [Pseudomonadota bacterium]